MRPVTCIEGVDVPTSPAGNRSAPWERAHAAADPVFVHLWRMSRFGCRMLVVAGGVGVVATVILAFTRPHPLGQAAGIVWAFGAVLPMYLLGAFLSWVRPDQVIARWLAALGSLLALQSAGTRAVGLLGGASAEWWLAAATALQFVTLATTAAIASLFVLLPDTGYRHRYQRWTMLAVWSAVTIVPVGLALTSPVLLFPDPAAAGMRIATPLSKSALSPLQTVFAGAFRWRDLFWITGVVVMLLRFGAADAATRRTFRWPLAAAAILAAFVVTFRLVDQVTPLPPAMRAVLLYTAWVPGLALVAVSVLVALLRHRLIGVDLAMRRSVLHGGVTLLIAVGQLGMAGLLGLVAGRSASLGAAIVVTLTVVVALQPLRRRLELRASEWVYGGRVQGSDLLRRVGQTLADAYDVDQLASNLAGAIVDGLGLEWARVTLRGDERGDGEPVAAVGIDPHQTATPDVVVPLSHAGEAIGFVECGPKRDAELSRTDEQLLATVAGQGALAIRNARLAAELEARLGELAASRSRIVAAQMTERRRIERNIHDGVQQEIVASIAKLRLARNQLARDASEAADTLTELQDDTRRILERLRELSRGIHPTVLSHRGLTDAVDTQARHSPLDVRIDASPDVRSTRYAEDVEATAYYVISEGLTNVLKHAGCAAATVRLRTTDGSLIAEVIDHGRGCAELNGTAGSGLVGLRDRVESIGGRLHIDSAPATGTTLRAELPARVSDNGDV